MSLIRVPDAAYQRLWVDMSYQIIAWLRAPGEGPARDFVCQCPHCGMDVILEATLKPFNGSYKHLLGHSEAFSM